MDEFKRFLFHKIWAFSLEGWRPRAWKALMEVYEEIYHFLFLNLNCLKLFGHRKPGVGSESASGSLYSKKKPGSESGFP
jgi:hypothetical protein